MNYPFKLWCPLYNFLHFHVVPFYHPQGIFKAKLFLKRYTSMHSDPDFCVEFLEKISVVWMHFSNPKYADGLFLLLKHVSGKELCIWFVHNWLSKQRIMAFIWYFAKKLEKTVITDGKLQCRQQLPSRRYPNSFSQVNKQCRFKHGPCKTAPNLLIPLTIISANLYKNQRHTIHSKRAISKPDTIFCVSVCVLCQHSFLASLLHFKPINSNKP